jgi:hypothetical protein
MEIFQNKYDTKKIVTYFCIVVLLCYFLPFIFVLRDAGLMMLSRLVQAVLVKEPNVSVG